MMPLGTALLETALLGIAGWNRAAAQGRQQLKQSGLIGAGNIAYQLLQWHLRMKQLGDRRW
jgi:hypothetical protein